MLQVECAELSLIGDRDENQDRVAVSRGENAVLMMVVDGMGGHANGARAAEVTVQTVTQAFSQARQPIFDPQGFLHRATGRAHANVVALGRTISVEARPRATCAICLFQDNGAYWAHVGDSRIYLLRSQKVVERTRDHSHVELLLQEGLISESELADHPMRNFVECCLGGDASLPGMSITHLKRMQPGDVMLACTDGFWGGVCDETISSLGESEEDISAALRRIGEQAVRTSSPYSDITSAVCLRWLS